MLLSELLADVDALAFYGPTSMEVGAPCFDSRAVEPGSVFVAVPGTQVDGHAYIDRAIERGAGAVVCERLPDRIPPGVTFALVRRSSVALGLMAATYYRHPSRQLVLVGVTGTNGKTTIATLLFRVFRSLGFDVGLFSTIRNQINESVFPATHTTPDALQLQSLMRRMVDAGCTHCFMEVTSHSADQDRIAGLDFDGAIFTNLTHDHLDYHGTVEAYYGAKKRFFDDLPDTAFALTNADDPLGLAIVNNTDASRYTYSLRGRSTFKGVVVKDSLKGLEVSVHGKRIGGKLVGQFNAYNLVAVFGAAVLLNIDVAELEGAMRTLRPVDGRFNCVVSERGVVGIVDFAHTPDGVEKAVEAALALRPAAGRLITVVGCGGERDREKRPLMARAAFEKSDLAIFTSDNPRSEEPLDIIGQMLAGLPPGYHRKASVIVDRRAAILAACESAQPGDVVLVAGRGHEEYQQIGREKIPFKDVEVLRDAFANVGRAVVAGSLAVESVPKETIGKTW